MESIKINQIKTLSDLRSSLSGFISDASTIINHIEKRLDTIDNEIKEKQKIDFQALEYRINQVKAAKYALEDCERYEDDDFIPNCSEEHEQLRIAQSEKIRADKKLSETIRWKTKIEKQFYEYRKFINKLKSIIRVDGEKGIYILQQLKTNIDRYLYLKTEDPSISSSDKNMPLSSSTTQVNADELNNSILSNSNNILRSDIMSIPTNKNKSNIQNVDIEGLTVNKVITGKNSFKKVSMKKMYVGLKKLLTIQKAIKKDIKCHSKDYWENFDNKNGTSSFVSYKKVYESFYVNKPIKIVKDGKNYSIDDGNHRVWVAQKMGIKKLPAVIIERNTNNEL